MIKLLSSNYSIKMLLLIVAISVVACERPKTLGTENLPDEDDVDFKVDTFDVDSFDVYNVSDTTAKFSTYLQTIDSLSDSIKYAMVGTYWDPVFGKTESSFAVKFGTYSRIDKTLPDEITMESITMRFGFPKNDTLVSQLMYGNPLTQTQTMQLYYTPTDINQIANGSYNSSQVLGESTLLAETPFSIDTTQLIDKQTMCLEFSLPQDFVKNFQNNRSTYLEKETVDYTYEKDDGEDTTVSTVCNTFKGTFYVVGKTISSGGCLFTFDLSSTADTLRNMEFCYSVEGTKYYTSLYPTSFFKYGHRNFVNFDHSDYFNQIVNSGQKCDSIMYIQSNGGAAIKLLMPDLSKYKGKYIHKAELQIPSENTDIPAFYQYLAPPLELRYIDKSNKFADLNVINESSPSKYEQSFDTLNTQYAFNLTQFVDFTANRDSVNKGLYLSAKNRDYYPSRTVLINKKGSRRMLLIIHYAELEEKKK